MTPPKDLVDVYRRLTPVALSGAEWDDDDGDDLLYELLSPLWMIIIMVSGQKSTATDEMFH